MQSIVLVIIFYYCFSDGEITVVKVVVMGGDGIQGMEEIGIEGTTGTLNNKYNIIFVSIELLKTCFIRYDKRDNRDNRGYGGGRQDYRDRGPRDNRSQSEYKSSSYYEMYY